jgi:hypothetical protein
MIRYKNTSGKSGIHSFQIFESKIVVRFTDGATYEYTALSVGRKNLQAMKLLAKQGHGLNGFINSKVRKNYSIKY